MAYTPIHQIEGVVLNSTGNAVEGSLGRLVQEVAANLHERGRVWPTLAAGVPVVSSGVNWQLGNAVVVMAAGTVATDFRLHAVVVEACPVAADAVLELVLYQGAGAGTEVSRIRFAVLGGFYGNAYYVIGGPIVPGGAQIQSAVASSNGGAEVATATISLCYHIVT